MERVVLASANPKKVAELRAILDGILDLVPRPGDVADVVEDAPTFVGNARLKATALVAATGMAALADDSGLEVDALDGAPGVWSARYAGEVATDEANVTKLLAVLADRAHPAGRRARFRCVLVLRRPDGTEVVADGTVEGHIALGAKGSGGFGYDPVFVPHPPGPPGNGDGDGDGDGDGRTFAELAPADKDAISHRGAALAVLVAKLTHLAAGTASADDNSTGDYGRGVRDEAPSNLRPEARDSTVLGPQVCQGSAQIGAAADADASTSGPP